MSQSITRRRFKELVATAAIGELFIELGWDHAKDEHVVRAGTHTHSLQTVAQKKGFAVLVHTSTSAFADKTLRQRIEKQIARLHHEHLIVFRSAKGDQQVWQLAMRRAHQPITYHEAIWHAGTDPEHLFQKLSGLFIPLEEEKGITLVDVKEKVTAQFEKNTKEVTKKFYREFSAQHKDFLKFIKGIKEKVDQEWYASLMLNRLMFIYFIQKKGFLDGDRDYLQKKLKESRKKRGDDKFYTFYRDFLLVLFHQGLGSPDRSKKLLAEIGKIPYLNGGLFDVHDLEKNHPIEIKDSAFEGLFAFFDTWNWHLDTRASSTGRDVNPDVIGYIFEQYINDRAQMGAYYTKEDITAYISKNTIIPWLFDEAKRKDAQAFKPEGGVWKLLRDDPDKYIYDSVGHGITDEMVQAIAAEDPATPWYRSALFADLPSSVKKGLDPDQKDLWKIRKTWNVRAPEDIALPTEIYREMIERRRRYLEVRKKLVAGEVTAINDLITYNLDIGQFAQDVLHEYEGSDLVGAFYDAIKSITILDPTCGSGAFLFAALGILEPLYAECLNRMQWFVEVDDEKGTGKKHPQFRAELERMKLHPNRDYFIYKSIILQNLYGVDIMREAVEIAKLRLFLKLVSTVDPDTKKDNYGIEPLPDIDFNIRSGNTLVGFATKAEVKGISAWTLDFDTKEQDRVEEKCDVVDKAFERYKQIQLNEGEDYQSFRKAKDHLQKRLAALRDELDVYLAKSYSITDLPKQQKQFDAWKASHTPFHWFAEYYGIVHQRGGFDVIIGNPPYVEFNKKSEYSIHGYDTLPCGNLYPLVMERSSVLAEKSLGRVGMIVMLNLTFAEGYSTLRKQIAQSSQNVWLSSYDNIPDGLFAGSPKEQSKNTNKVVSQRVCISLFDRGRSNSTSIHTSHFLRWNKDFRHTLFEVLHYGTFDDRNRKTWPALGNSTAVRVDSLLHAAKAQPLLALTYPKGSSFLQLAATPRYFISAVPEPLNRSGLVEIRFSDVNRRMVVESVLNSTLFYWYWRATGDGFHLTKGSIDAFPVASTLVADKRGVEKTVQMLASVLETCRTSKLNKGQVVHNVNYNIASNAMPQIDALLGGHYGLSGEELDYVINYDIKYRMGSELEGEE